ncbi:Fur family transcriptional regulator [Insolitispirillum peregrinum]|uniref:Ferric uptake regulation protein n=1 Tax=Insolitispirillum peregrinum TaxID=80876 RepID=A0A1N7IMD4_9PROT|nr:transcriptional repressor [Insolitispirillum peregrinum]SIS38212.1 Fur family transcriptional regulator, iron response regulator [Insolitispirillum peregrinum]
MAVRDATLREPAPQTLRRHRILPTRQRIAMLEALRDTLQTHISPDQFHRDLTEKGQRLSLATVYNTLNQFAAAGLVRRIGFGERIWFCTDPNLHHHYFNESLGTLEAMNEPFPLPETLPSAPAGTEICGIDIIVRLRNV